MLTACHVSRHAMPEGPEAQRQAVKLLLLAAIHCKSDCRKARAHGCPELLKCMLQDTSILQAEMGKYLKACV